MGLEIVLQTELGAHVDAVADPKNYLGKLLPEVDGEKYPLLGGIDPYGDTIFNRIQMRRFLLEWIEVSAKAGTPEERQLVSKIEELARRCRDEVHLYIRFVGD
jgi:hypothetical protein